MWKAYSVTCANPLCFSQYTYTQFRHTTFSVSITMSRLSTHSLIWAFVLLNKTRQKCFEQFLNLNSGEEVGLYLFPVPVLFFPRDWSSGIVHPDNGAAVGIVALFCPGSPVFCRPNVTATPSKASEGWWKWAKGLLNSHSQLRVLVPLRAQRDLCPCLC